MRSKLFTFLCAALLLGGSACRHESGGDLPLDPQYTPVKLAVVLPMGPEAEAWTRVLAWVQENVQKASGTLVPQYELYNEEEVPLESLAQELASQKDLTAVIGCYHSEHTHIMAASCAKTYKPLFTFSTGADLPRAYGQRGFLWFLTESDIAQSELLLIQAARNKARRVSLLAVDNHYGQTFKDWFSFQAQELGMEVGKVVCYKPEEVEKGFAEVTQEASDCLICIPASMETAGRIMRTYKASSYPGKLLFSDVAYSPNLINTYGDLSNGMEGYCPTSDPSSGFEISYQVRFGEVAPSGASQLYDAVMTACFAYRYAQLHELEMNEAIGALLSQKTEIAGMWDKKAMAEVFNEIETGGTPAFSGASGFLDFSPEYYTSVTHSTYAHWLVYEGQLLHLEYDRRSGKESSVYAAWEWDKDISQDFDPTSTLVYPYCQGRRAVVVAASKGWNNYRHQADALEVYQLLKQNGFDDDRIVLIMADDLAFHPLNPQPGVITRTPQGANLYNQVEVDYRLDELSPADLHRILTGQGDKELRGSNTENVFFFWSGHGTPGNLCWGEEEELSAASLAGTFRQMAGEGRFRQMLCFIEACYSGSVAEECTGIPGLLLFTAANANETSKADVFNPQLGIWMTNRFTSVFLEEVKNNPNLRALYSALFRRTLGSHVCVYNAPAFGSVYQTFIAEFVASLYQ